MTTPATPTAPAPSATMLKTPRASIVKGCRCGQRFDLGAWEMLPTVGPAHLHGVQVVDDEMTLEMRNCPCGSTLALEVSHVFEATPHTPRHVVYKLEPPEDT